MNTADPNRTRKSRVHLLLIALVFLAPMIAAALAAKGGLPPVGLYLSGAALISLAALVPLARRTQHDLG